MGSIVGIARYAFTTVVCAAACASDGTAKAEGTETTSGTGTTAGSSGGPGTTTQPPILPDFGCSCGGCVELDLEVPRPNVALTVDESGSMVQNTWDHDLDGQTPEITRWQSLRGTVELFVEQNDERIDMGLVLFPSSGAEPYGADACPVDATAIVPIGPMNGANVLAALPHPMATDLVGATPATKAVETARSELELLDPLIPRYIVLITDGAANCGAAAMDDAELMECYDEEVEATVASAFASLGIRTLVVGIDIVDAITGQGIDGEPEVNPAEKLDAIAALGGPPGAGAESFYNAHDETALSDAMAEVAAQLCNCRVSIDREIEFPAWLYVEIDGVRYDHASGGPPPIDLAEPAVCGETESWVYANPDGPYDSIELCGGACSDLCDGGELQLLAGCPPL